MELLERVFERIGAPGKFSEALPRWVGGRRVRQNLALNVRSDARGEFFFVSRDRAAVEELVSSTCSKDRFSAIPNTFRSDAGRWVPGLSSDGGHFGHQAFIKERRPACYTHPE